MYAPTVCIYFLFFYNVPLSLLWLLCYDTVSSYREPSERMRCSWRPYVSGGRAATPQTAVRVINCRCTHMDICIWMLLHPYNVLFYRMVAVTSRVSTAVGEIFVLSAWQKHGKIVDGDNAYISLPAVKQIWSFLFVIRRGVKNTWSTGSPVGVWVEWVGPEMNDVLNIDSLCIEIYRIILRAVDEAHGETVIKYRYLQSKYRWL